jgi:RimJ/RimL family protein N-acetyltransferase
MVGKVNIRPLSVDDLELVLAWRSNPQIYKYFNQQDSALSWEAHMQWFATRSDKRLDFIIEYCGRRVGCVSVSADNRVSIYIGEVSLWGNGVAKSALKSLIDQIDRKLVAEVHENNIASQQLFEDCGFTKVSDGEWFQYEYEED